MKQTQDRSTALDNKLKDCLDLIQRGEYNSCKKKLDTFTKQLKNPEDKFYLDIVKMHFTAKKHLNTHYLEMRDRLTKQALEDQNEYALRQMKAIFMELGDWETHSKLVEAEFKGINFELSKEDRIKEFMRQMLFTGNYAAIYKSLAKLGKNIVAESKLLKKEVLQGLKAICLYCLCYKEGKLPAMFADKEFAVVKETEGKGAVDMKVKYFLHKEEPAVLALEDKEARTPLNSVKQEVLFTNGKEEELVFQLSKEILDNIDKLEFVLIERLVNISVKNNSSEGEIKDLALEPINEANQTINLLIALNKSKLSHFYAKKNIKVGILLYIALTERKQYSSLFFDIMLETLALLENKQGSLAAVKPFLVYLTEEEKEKIVSIYEENKIYHYKLKILLFSNKFDFSTASELINKLVEEYKTAPKEKIRVGERISADVYLEMANELLLDQEKRTDSSTIEFNKLLYSMFELNKEAFKISPYNFNLGLQLVNYCQLTLSYMTQQLTLSKMNLKNLQFESFMYLYQSLYSLKNFKKFKLDYEAYKQDNRMSLPVVLYNMIVQQNYYDFEETKLYQKHCFESYESVLFQMADALALGDQSQCGYNAILDKFDKFKLNRNSDVHTALPRFTEVETVGSSVYDRRFKIDCINREHGVYDTVPGDFSNWVEQRTLRVFGPFDKADFLKSRLAMLAGDKERFKPSEILGEEWEISLFSEVDKAYCLVCEGKECDVSKIYALLNSYLSEYEDSPYDHVAKRKAINSFYASVRYINIPLIRDAKGKCKAEIKNKVTAYLNRVTKSNILKNSAESHIPLDRQDITEIKETCRTQKETIAKLN